MPGLFNKIDTLLKKLYHKVKVRDFNGRFKG